MTPMLLTLKALGLLLAWFAGHSAAGKWRKKDL